MVRQFVGWSVTAGHSVLAVLVVLAIVTGKSGRIDKGDPDYQGARCCGATGQVAESSP